MIKINPELQLEKKCNSCESDSYTILHSFPKGYYNTDAFVTHSWDGNKELELQIVRCSSCGLVYQNPCINEAGMRFIYPTEIIPDNLNYNSLMKNHKFHFILDVIRKFYPKGNNKNAVDIGTRYGVLPSLLNQKGFNAFGIEYNPKCVEAVEKQGYDHVVNGKAEDLADLMNTKNVDQVGLFIMVDVIEHLLNPSKVLEVISGMQKKGDRILVETMNINSLGYKLFKKDWYYLHMQHTYYFNEKTIKDLFKKYGYEIEYIHQIAKYKNLRTLPGELKKWKKGRKERKLYSSVKLENRKWFAQNRPFLFDNMLVVFKKV